APPATLGSSGPLPLHCFPTRRSSDLSAHNEFAAGSTYSDTFSVASADGTLTAVTINILGTNDAAVLSAATKNLTETNLAADISTSDKHTTKHHSTSKTVCRHPPATDT